MAIDFTLPVSQVRAIIPDADEDNFILTDDLINVYLSITNNKVYLAAALALDAIAVDEALTYKITKTDDLSVNGVTGAELLRKRATDLRAAQAADDRDGENAFQIVFPEQGHYRQPEATARVRPWGW